MTVEEESQQQHDNAGSRNAASEYLGNVFKKPAWMTQERKSGFTFRDFFSAKTLIGWPPEEMTRETAWLDGLRGVAAFLVMIYHYGLDMWNPLFYEMPYGGQTKVNGEILGPPTYEFWRLPFFRLWMDSGHTQVSVFFVLSGFVLSWGPLASINKGQLDKFAQSLGSATFRRWIRLYFPCFAVAGWEAFEIQVGLREHPGKGPQSNLFKLLFDYLRADEHFANPFDIKRTNWSSLHEYDWTMWTIPFEFSGSLLVFLLCLAICRFRHFGKRSTIIFIVAAYACYKAEWTFWLFSAGMCISNYVRHVGGFKGLNERATSASTVAWTAVLIVGLYLAGFPEGGENYTRPGYEWLDNVIPYEWKDVEGGGRFIWCWAGILIVLSACHLSLVRRLFEMSFMRYLGRISYMLYLTHRIVLNLFGDPWKRFVWSAMGKRVFITDYETPEDWVGHSLSVLFTYLVLMVVWVPLAIFVAHWAEVLIDRPSTKLAKLVDDWFKRGGDEQPDKSENGSILPTHNAPEMSSRHQEQETGVIPASERYTERGEESAGLLPPSEFEMTELPPRPDEFADLGQQRAQERKDPM